MIFITLPVFIILGITLYMSLFYFWLYGYRKKIKVTDGIGRPHDIIQPPGNSPAYSGGVH
ncbi:MAG: hypothetical protein JW881_17865 [Spirochaetales bacterium]|nr:hypothetical protein [Spirochaetales bacterium]